MFLRGKIFILDLWALNVKYNSLQEEVASLSSSLWQDLKKSIFDHFSILISFKEASK